MLESFFTDGVYRSAAGDNSRPLLEWQQWQATNSPQRITHDEHTEVTRQLVSAQSARFPGRKGRFGVDPSASADTVGVRVPSVVIMPVSIE